MCDRENEVMLYTEAGGRDRTLKAAGISQTSGEADRKGREFRSLIRQTKGNNRHLSHINQTPCYAMKK